MTRERAKELLPVITAFAEGETIQCRLADGSWVDMDDASFLHNNSYRIKSGPREFWLHACPDTDGEFNVGIAKTNCIHGKTIHVREVLE